VATVSWTLDHTGPMARSAVDVGLALDVLAGSPLGAIDGGCAGLRVGVPQRWFREGTDADVLAAADDALAVLVGLGATRIEVEVPEPELGGIAAWAITVAEFAEVNTDWRDHVADYTTAAAERLVAGSALSAGDYLRARRVRSDLRARCTRLFDDVDVLLTPATPTAAPRIVPPLHPMFEDGDRMWLDHVARDLILFNLLGLPAIVVPAGRSDDGRPLAVQVVGPALGDRAVLTVAAAFQAATAHGGAPVRSVAHGSLQ
jgi:aspartyl-tRNA(Asn)/glutamyl-tRNA(Gln) amidotransferase subunit A